MDTRHALDEAIRLAGVAGAKLREKQATAKKIEQSRKDFVTDADQASEALIVPQLQRSFPKATIYSEEAGGTLRQEGWQWIVDPLDGTWMYFNRLPMWGVSVALAHDGQAHVGAVAIPSMDTVFAASADQEIKVTVSATSDLAESLVWADWTKIEYPDITLDTLGRLARSTRYPCIVVSCTYGMMQVALGHVDAYVCPAPAVEDHAAAGLIVQKAGGTVTDFAGIPWTPFSKSLVASNGRIHEKLLKLLQ